MLKVEDIYVDLKDGVELINLLEIISSKKLPKYKKKCKIALHEIGNLNIALDFIREEGLKLVNIDSQDLHSGNPKLILGLLWTLILRYQIQMGGDGGSPKQDLLDWINRQTAPYRDHIPEAINFTKSFQNGCILAALADSLKPGIIDTKSLNDPLRDTDNAMGLSEENFNIPRLVDANDMVHTPDEHANMTYLACFRDYLENKAKMNDEAKLKGPHPGNCFAKGKGVEGGFARRPLPFTIYSRSVSDQPVVGKFIKPMQVKVTGPDGEVSCEVKDNSDRNPGTFFCKYIAPCAGDYHVEIKVQPEGQPLQDIKGSVYNLKVIEPADPSKSWAEGPGLVRVFDNAPGLFTVHAIDKDGNPVPGDRVTCQVDQIEIAPDAGREGMKTVPVEVKDNGDGTYSVKYDAIVPGKYRVNAMIDQVSIKDMPVDVACYRAPDPKQCLAEGPGVTQGVPRVGLDAPFEVSIRDRFGKIVPCGGHDFKVIIKGPNNTEVPCDIKDDDSGIYKCNYKPEVPGDYVVDVRVNGEDIKDNPFRLNIKKPADPSKSYAEGPGLIQAWDDKKNPFKIHALDEDGVPVSSEPVTATIAPAGGGDAQPIEVTDNGDGTYDAAYTVPPGDYVISVAIRDEPIKDMPVNVTCHKGISAEKSKVTGPGVTGGFAGRVLPFTVTTIDRDGNPVTVGNGGLTSKVFGPNGPIESELKDNGDGTYSGSYKPVIPGKYRVLVLLDEGQTPLGKSPYNVKVRPGASPAASFAVGRGWKEAYDCIPTRFTIYAKDDEGEPVPGEKIRVVMRNKTSPAEQKKIDDKLATMDDYLKQKKLGEVKRVEDERKAKQEEAAKEDADAKEEKNSWCDEEGDVMVTVRDNGDGSYLADYTAANPGTYEVSVTVGEDEEHIKDSPKKVPVHLSMPTVVFWAHTHSAQKEEMVRLKKALAEAQQLIQANGL